MLSRLLPAGRRVALKASTPVQRLNVNQMNLSQHLRCLATTADAPKDTKDKSVAHKSDSATLALPAPEPGVIEQYGLYPFIGLAAAALVSKEIFLLGPEFLLAITLTGFFGTLYVGAGDSVAKYGEEDNAIRQKQLQAGSEYLITLLETYKSAIAASTSQADVMSQFTQEFETVVKEWHVAKAREAHIAAQKAVVNKLTSIAVQESTIEAQERGRRVEKALTGALQEFKTDAKLRARILDFVIPFAGAPAPKVPVAEDPIKQVFLKHWLGEEEYKKIEQKK